MFNTQTYCMIMRCNPSPSVISGIFRQLKYEWTNNRILNLLNVLNIFFFIILLHQR